MRLQLLHAQEQQELMDDQRKREIGARIRDLRIASPYTQQAAADRVGVTLRAFQKWEQGRGITYENVERVAAVFEVDVDYVLKGPASQPPLLNVLNGNGESVSQPGELLLRLAAIEEQIRLLRAELAANDAAALKRNEEVLHAIRRSR